MANHSSSIKRIRQNKKKKLSNKYLFKSTKTAIKKFINKDINDKDINKKNYFNITSMIDKLSKKNIIHYNKANRIKRKLTKKNNIIINKDEREKKSDRNI